MVQQATGISASDPFQQALALTRAALQELRRGERSKGERLLRAALRLDPQLGVAWLWLAALQQGARRSICLRWARLTLPEAEIPALETLLARPRPLRRRRGRRALLVGGVLAASLLAACSAELHYRGRVFPGVSAFGQELSGQTPAEVSALLAAPLSVWSHTELSLYLGKAHWSAPLGTIGRFERDLIAERALAAGGDQQLLGRLLDRGERLLGMREVLLRPTLDGQAVEGLLERVATLVDQSALPARFQWFEGRWIVLPERAGLVLDREAARADLAQAWDAHTWSARPRPLELQLRLLDVAPTRTSAELAPLLPQLARQTAAPLELAWGESRLALARGDLLDLQRTPAAGRPFSASRQALDELLAGLAVEIDRPAQPSQLVREGNRVREFQPGQPGARLDRQLALERLAAALERGDASVTLPIDVTAPPAGEAEALGLVAVLGEGNSQFATYTSPDRDQNVLVGGLEFDGLLIPPGATISAGETIGEISWEKGYRWGDMISGGMVVPSLGGGICQVATTLYRAAFWSGLEIQERHNHNWRLPWYEADAPAGMDATIALGGPDLKIRNNTSQYLLLEVTTDLEQKTQRITIYGTPQGWEVAMAQRWDGGAIVIDREVRQAGQVVLQDSFTSYYTQ
jgi:vancomycin resistance protein YoaR